MEKHSEIKNIQTVILGIGNILLGDEGIGIHVIKEVEKMSLSPHVKVIDGATAGYGLLPIFETYKDSEFLIVDAVKISESSLKETLECKSTDSGRVCKKNSKGDIYVIPLHELYDIGTSSYPGLEFVSFHQTGLMDVLTLLQMTTKIKINGYLIGVNIFDDTSTGQIYNFSMELSEEIKKKIPKIVEILKKHLK